MLEYWADVDSVFENSQFHVQKVEAIDADRVLYRGRVTARGKASGVPLDVAIWGIWEIRDRKFGRGGRVPDGGRSPRSRRTAAIGESLGSHRPPAPSSV